MLGRKFKRGDEAMLNLIEHRLFSRWTNEEANVKPFTPRKISTKKRKYMQYWA